MPLALFDLDNTLIAGDSDYAWGQFLVAVGKVDGAAYARANQQFFRDYQAGKLDIAEYLRFALAPLARLEPQELAALHSQFMREVISAMWLPRAEALLTRHRAAGDELLIITSTNRFVAEPICRQLGVEAVIATEPEVRDGRYTGAVVGRPSFGEGKVVRLQQWLSARGEPSDNSLSGSFFYSDSINDLPLLLAVDNPVAVDPDAALRAIAAGKGWPIISLRDTWVGGSAE